MAERLLADFAFVRSLTGVSTHVHFQLRPLQSKHDERQILIQIKER